MDFHKVTADSIQHLIKIGFWLSCDLRVYIDGIYLFNYLFRFNTLI